MQLSLVQNRTNLLLSVARIYNVIKVVIIKVVIITLPASAAPFRTGNDVIGLVPIELRPI